MPLPSPFALAGTVLKHPLYMQNLLVKKFTSLARYRWAERNAGKDDKVPPPLGYKLVLTYKCNLRCVMCYEWGEVGWCHEAPKKVVARELDFAVVEKLFRQVAHRRPYFILHGGEPLLYSHFGEIAGLLKRHQCFAITCTNGTALENHLDALADNPYLTFLVSLDGTEPVNDQLRGPGVYKRVVSNIRRLKALRRPPYVGIQFTIRPENVGVMYEFCREMVELGVDWVLLNPCWFVSEDQARAYEDFMVKHFGLMPRTHLGYLMPYPLDKDVFIEQYRRIRQARWPIQISCYLKKPEDIHTYIDTPAVPPDNTFCYQQWTRMDITPDGDVTPCILYPDLKVGNLHDQNVMEIWNSEKFARFRKVRRLEVLPVCAKCNAIYLHDSKRKVL
jgi:radical SAM protein with 4Fe4S-binding SPASM domain